MTITVNSLPAVPWLPSRFDPVRPHSVSRMRGRRTEQVIRGTPYWTATYGTPALTPREFGLVEAFMMTAGDGGEVFRAYDTDRPRPIEAGATPLTWTPNLTNITGNGSTVTISGVGNGFQFRAGDYVEFAMSDLVVSLHRIAEDAQANGSGVVTLSIRYPLDTQHFTTAAVPNFEKPSCIMQIEPGSYGATKVLGERRASFSAQEMFFYETEED